MKNLLFVVLLVFPLTLSAETVAFPRYPDPSPDGKQILFSYQGDIWLVGIQGGQATRLTVHKGYDYLPMWSPDGNRIAFVSDRNGGDDLYSMNASGGDLRRHTYYHGGNRLLGWRRDSKSLLFSSTRLERYHWLPEIYRVGLEGKTPEKFLPIKAIRAKESPNGKTLVYVTGLDHRWRKRYRGSANNDIFSFQFKSQTFKQLTDFDGNDFNPMPAKEGIFYITEESGYFNIHYMDYRGENKRQVTHFKGDGVRHAAISQDGSTIAFTENLDLYALNTTSNKFTKIEVSVPEDSPFDNLEIKTFKSGISEMAPSPEGDEIAVVYHGEIYVYKADDKKTGRMSRLTEAESRERNAVWSPDGQAIYYLSDGPGQYDVFQITPREKRPFHLNKYFKTKRLTESDQSENNLAVSPDGNYLSFVRGNGNLTILNLENGTEKTLVSGWNMGSYRWSPDSRFIAFDRADNNFNTDVFIVDLAGSDPINISQHPDSDSRPFWSPDGKKLAFSSRRYRDTDDILYVYLQKADADKSQDDWALEEELKALKKEKKKLKNKKGKGGETGDSNSAVGDTEKKLEVKIDFKDISHRVQRLTNHIGDETIAGISKDGKTFIYRLSQDGGSDLFSLQEWKDKPKPLTTGKTNPTSITLGSEFKTIYYRTRTGAIHSMNLKGKDKKSFKYKGSFSQNKSLERLQVFQEGWRIQNDSFYDKEFHGADWTQVRLDYRKKVLAARSERDFADAMNMMLGELNASHQRYGSPRGSTIAFGNLGIQVTAVKQGVKIVEIMKDGPLDKSGSKAMIGDVITEVDGQSFNNFHSTLRDTVGDLVDLTVTRGSETLTLRARPGGHRQITNELAHRQWVESNRERVHSETENRLGYIHIKGMNLSSLEQFETELFSEAEGKDALIIDVRFNGGGWTTDLLLNILTTPEHAYTIPRGGEKGYPQGRRTFYHWTKPVLVLCNEFSYSNAEIFSHAIKELKRGTVIGRATFGAVISTGSRRLLNGGSIRLPFRGWYVKSSGVNQENNGAIPHHEVIPSQDEIMRGKDSQLSKAIMLFNTGNHLP